MSYYNYDVVHNAVGETLAVLERGLQAIMQHALSFVVIRKEFGLQSTTYYRYDYVLLKS